MSEVIKLDDGHASLQFDYDPENLGKGVFILTMADGGGFTSLYVTPTDWREFKKNVDEFLANNEDLK
jgi:nitrogen regulatory protein PII-like uncharacterized protein